MQLSLTDSYTALMYSDLHDGEEFDLDPEVVLCGEEEYGHHESESTHNEEPHTPQAGPMEVEQCLDRREHITKYSDHCQVEGKGLGCTADETSVHSKPQKTKTVDKFHLTSHLFVGAIDKVKRGSVEAVVESGISWTRGTSGLFHHCDIDKERETEENGQSHNTSQEPRGEGFITRVPQTVFCLQVLISLLKFEVETLFNDPVVEIFSLFKCHRRKKTLDSLASVDSSDGYVFEDNREENGGYKEEEGEEEPSQEVHQGKGRDVFLHSVGVVVAQCHRPQYCNQTDAHSTVEPLI